MQLKYGQLVFFIFATVVLKDCESLCVNKTALSSIEALVRKQRNSKSIRVIDENFNTLDSYIDIDVTKANVTHLCEGMVKNFPRLESLSLINVNLSIMEPGTFQDIPKLKLLYLSVNHLTTIQKGVFNAIPTLKTIYLTHNEIETIESGAFSDMPELKAIYLDHNKLMEIKGDIFTGSPKVSLLDLSFNLITKVQKSAFDDLAANANTKLLNIFLKKNQIAEIETEAFPSHTPVNLHLEGNEIYHVANILLSVKEGSSIYLSNNKITCLADDVLDLIRTRDYNMYAKNNPIECSCIDRIEKTMTEETRGNLEIESNCPGYYSLK